MRLSEAHKMIGILALLVVAPLLAIVLLSSWFLDAERTTRLGEQRLLAQDRINDVAASLRRSVDRRAYSEAMQLLRLSRSVDHDSLRARLDGNRFAAFASLYDPDGIRLFPPEQELLIFAEKSMLDMSALQIASARGRARTDRISWGGTLIDQPSAPVACLKDPGGTSACLLVSADPMLSTARRLLETIQEPHLSNLNIEELAVPGEHPGDTLFTPLSGPFAGYAITARYSQSVPYSLSGVLALVAPALVASLFAAILLYWGIRTRQRADAERIQLLAQVSHELRTPLANFRLYSALMTKARLRDANVDRYCTVIEEETDRLSRIVNNALTWVRDDRDTSPRMESAVPDELVQETIKRFAPSFEGRITIAYDLNAAAFSTFAGDALRQVVINVLDNACKHASGAVVSVSTRLSEGALVLRISDTGACESDAGRSGGPNRQLTDMVGQRGFGIGLRACEVLARAAGGTFESLMTRDGSEFRLLLPCQSGGPLDGVPTKAPRDHACES